MWGEPLIDCLPGHQRHLTASAGTRSWPDSARRPDRGHRERQEHRRPAVRRLGVPRHRHRRDRARRSWRRARRRCGRSWRPSGRDFSMPTGALDRRRLRDHVFADAGRAPAARGHPASAHRGSDAGGLRRRRRALPGPRRAAAARVGLRPARRPRPRRRLSRRSCSAQRLLARDGEDPAPGRAHAGRPAGPRRRGCSGPTMSSTTTAARTSSARRSAALHQRYLSLRAGRCTGDWRCTASVALPDRLAQNNLRCALPTGQAPNRRLKPGPIRKWPCK